MTARRTPPTPPDPFNDTFVAMTAARAVIGATRLGIFDELERTPATADALAARLGLDPTGAQTLLSALASLGYLRPDRDGVYRLTPAGSRLTHGAGESIARFIGSFNAHAWTMLSDLEEMLLGRRTPDSHQRPHDDPYWEDYIRGLSELVGEQADRLARMLPISGPCRLLDIGGGHGGFAIAMCRAHPMLQATILDLPASAAIGRQIVAEHGLTERIAFREGDALTDSLGEGLDLISAFNLLHHLPRDAVPGLLHRAHAALRDGATMVIGETERSEQRSVAGIAGAMSGLIYYVSSGTRNYTRQELCHWLQDAGFGAIELRDDETARWRLTILAHS